MYGWNTNVKYTGTNVNAFLEHYYNVFTVSPVYELRHHKDKSGIKNVNSINGSKVAEAAICTYLSTLIRKPLQPAC